MKLKEIIANETMLTGSDLSTSQPFPIFPTDSKFEGKMEGGLEVYSFKFNDTIIFGVKIEDEYASFLQVKTVILPNLGKVLETLNAKTKDKYAKQLLSVKLKMFITLHTGQNLMLGAVHSIATETLLKSGKVQNTFDVKLVNTKTGEIIDWSNNDYDKVSSKFSPTDWQVLLIGNKKPFNEDLTFAGDILGEDHLKRHKWTYGEYFVDWNLDLEC